MITSRTKTAAFGLVGLTWFLLVFGSTVRVNGAGLACPDWPLCFGQLVPAYDFGVYLEFGHRVVAGVVSLLFVGLSFSLWRSGAVQASKAIRTIIPLAALALLVQVILGGLTVLELLAEWTVSSHLLTGNTFCTLLLLLALSVRELADRPSRAAVTVVQRGLPVLLGGLVLAQLVLGGFVSSSFAGLACGTWPSCNGAGWFPTFAGPVGLQVMHRITAYTILAVALLNVAVQWSHPLLRTRALTVLGFVLVQVALGVANVLLHLPVEVTLAHSGTAAAILLSTGWQGFDAFAAPVRVAQQAPATAAPVEAL